MGPSGSGKTTLLNVISGLTPASEGKVFINGTLLQKLSDNQKADIRRTQIGFIFQFYNLHEGLTALENVELPMLINGSRNRRERTQVATHLLELVGLEHRINNHPYELSGGEKARVGIARALANDPPILLADEPTGDLDSKLAREIMELLHSLNQKHGKTLVIVTHDSSILKKDMRLLKMEDGRIEDDVIVTEDTMKELTSIDEAHIKQVMNRA
jgi:putative ABC transport system ATP-binding protein